MTAQSAMVLIVKPDPAFYTGGKSYPDAEAAIVAAKRRAKARGESQEIIHQRQAMATVQVSGIVDLTWAGSAGITCNPPKRSHGASKEKLP